MMLETFALNSSKVNREYKKEVQKGIQLHPHNVKGIRKITCINRNAPFILFTSVIQALVMEEMVAVKLG